MRSTMLSVALGAALFALGACAQETPASRATPPQPAAATLLEADRAVAQRTEANGGVADLVSAFDPEVVIFAPPEGGFSIGPQAGYARLISAWGGEPQSLHWSAIRSGASADGLHGFTFGYIEAEVANERRLAKYLAYWVRHPDGWRIRLYKLLPRPEGDVSLDVLAPFSPATRSGASSEQDQAAYVASLAAREQEFSNAAQELGLSAAFARFGRADAMNLGGDANVVIGADNISATQPPGPGSPLSWSADHGALVASSGDLGVTWGMLRRNGPTPPGRLAEIPFFTVWARDDVSDPWLYIAE